MAHSGRFAARDIDGRPDLAAVAEWFVDGGSQRPTSFIRSLQGHHNRSGGLTGGQIAGALNVLRKEAEWVTEGPKEKLSLRERLGTSEQ